MAIDPRRLRPSELCRLLNSTPMGEVIGERQLHRRRTRAGLRITSTADPRNIDLLRYVAWLVSERHKPRPEPEGLTGYDAPREGRAFQRIAIHMTQVATKSFGRMAVARRLVDRARASHHGFRTYPIVDLDLEFDLRGPENDHSCYC